MTIQRALSKLVEEGCVQASKGRDYFVLAVPSSRRLDLGTSKNASSKMTSLQKGMLPSSKIVSLTKVKPTEELLDCFNEFEELYGLIRLSLINVDLTQYKKLTFLVLTSALLKILILMKTRFMNTLKTKNTLSVIPQQI